jgi:hypothetical protein
MFPECSRLLQVSVAFCSAHELDLGEMVVKLVRVAQGRMRSLGLPVKVNHFLSRNTIVGDD